MKIPSNYFLIKVVGSYIFIFTKDQKCILFDSTDIRSTGLKLISTLYLPYLTDYKSKIVIVPDYTYIDGYYGMLHAIYVRTNDDEVMLYQTIDRIRKYPFNYRMDK